MMTILPSASLAQTPANFQPIANYQNSDIQGLYQGQNTPSGSGFTITLNGFMIVALSVGGFLAVIKLIQAGFLYQGGDFWDKKQRAKEIIQNVVLGLLLLFGSSLLIYQINPCILDAGKVFTDLSGKATATCSVPY